MVYAGERLSLAPVRIGAGEQGRSEGPRVEPGGLAFLCEQDVVQVGEDRSEPSHRPKFAFVNYLLSGFGLGALDFLAAGAFGWAERDREAGAAGFDLDLFEGGASFFEAGGADASGAVGDRFDDEGVLAANADDVAFDGMATHLPDGTPVLLDAEQIAAEVYATVDREALRLGELLELARDSMSRAGFERWVETELPFDLPMARRLRAVYLGYRELPPEMLKEMPLPWQSLFVKPSD